MPNDLDFESLVAQYYEPLYRFAFSLARAEADACDLTQQTFTIWAAKGQQLRDSSKVKTFLFSILYREFLASSRRRTRFPEVELEDSGVELPNISPAAISSLDTSEVLSALARVDEVYRAPVALFYLQDYSYNEIAGMLEIPLGTVKSRLARGIGQLQQLMSLDLDAGKNL